MKPWIIKIAAGTLAFAAVSLSSCKKDEVRTILTPSNSPTLTASATTVSLTQVNAASTAATFTWTPVKSLSISDNTTVVPAITYYLQFDKKGRNFATPVSLPAGNASPTGASTTTVTVSDLNTALTTLGLTPGTATDVEVRLNASYASNSSNFSNVVPLSATTYAYCAQPAKSWSIIGPAGPGWSDDYTMTYDCGTKTYTYVGSLTADDFKFRFGKHWATNLGGTGASTPLATGGANLSITPAGKYTVTLYNAADTTSLSKAYYTIK